MPAQPGTSLALASNLANMTNSAVAPSLAAKAAAGNGVFWQGADGNVYVKGDKGVNSAGAWDNNTNSYWGGRGFNQIADPNAPKAASNTGSSSGGSFSGGGAAGTAAVAGPIAPTAEQLAQPLASLAQLDTILNNKNAQTDAEYNRAIGGYDAQDKLDKQTYDQNDQENNSSLARNNQAALLNATNAGTGLRGVLSSLGGLAGSGENIVRRLVNLAANSDAGAARQTFDTNATQLNTEWQKTDQAEKQRRADADATHADDLQNNKAQVLNSRQSILQQIASLWGAETPQGKNYASQAASLAAPIAETTKATVAPYQAPSSLFSPAALANYLAGTKNLNVSTSIDPSATPVTGPAINSPQFAQKKNDTLSGVA